MAESVIEFRVILNYLNESEDKTRWELPVKKELGRKTF